MEKQIALESCRRLADWCYVRDAVSGAWGYLEYYKTTGEEECLERAVLWAKWFMKHVANLALRHPTVAGAIELECANGKAELTVPDGTTALFRGRELKAGKHTFDL